MFFIYKGIQLKQKIFKILKIISKTFKNRRLFTKLLDEKKSLLILL